MAVKTQPEGCPAGQKGKKTEGGEEFSFGEETGTCGGNRVSGSGGKY